MTLTDNKVNKILEKRQQGMSLRDIAKTCNVDKNSVAKYVKEYYGRPIQKKQTIPKIVPQNNNFAPAFDQTQYGAYGPYHSQSQNIYDNQNHFELNPESMDKIRRQMEEERRVDELINESKKKRKIYQKIDDEMCSLKQKLEEKKSQEREEAQMNQLQHEIEMLKIDQKYLKNQLEFKPSAQIDNSALKVMNEKENEKKYTVLKTILVREEIKNQENAEIDKIVREVDVVQNNKGQNTKNATVDLEVVPKSSNSENDFESNEETDGVEIPSWVPIVIGSACKNLKKWMNFLDSPDGKLPISSPEYWKKLFECLRNNN